MNVLLAAFLGLIGCRSDAVDASSSPPARPQQPVTDALGRRVSVSPPVRRAVSLAPNLTEVVFIAGAGGRLVGVTTADDFPSAVDTITQVQAYPQIDFEAVAALRPDLVLATDQVNARRDAATLEALDAPTYFFSFSSLSDIFSAVETTGRLLGTPRHAAHAADSLRSQVRQLRRRTAQIENRPHVLFLIGDETLYTFSEGSYVHEMIRLAGGQSVTADLRTDAPLSEEFVLETRPDVIVGAFGTDYDPARLRRLHPAWQGVVPALTQGRVYSVPPPLFLRPGPRSVAGAQQLARLLHPSLFQDASPLPSPTAEAR